MKIGIVTYHRTYNYGAVMQALATRLVLEEMGHEAYYVDYWPDYHKDFYSLFSKNSFLKLNAKQKVKFLLDLIRYFRSKKRRIDNFENFFQTQIYPYCRPLDESYDVVIYGSDQIWRKQNALGTYNPFYFGKNELKTKYHISYAASMGILPDKDTDKENVKTLVSHLDKLSVREEDLRNLLQSLGYNNVSLSLDPTLLLSSEIWDKYMPTEPYRGEKYALVYILGGNGFDLKEIKNFTDKKGLKLVVLRGYARTKETKANITSAGPLEFIRLIKNADYVFCASFHGLAFSIIYGRQFFTSFLHNSGRAESLLKIIGCQDRLLAPMSKIPLNLPPVDYDDVSKRMMSIKKESLKYLADIKQYV